MKHSEGSVFLFNLGEQREALGQASDVLPDSRVVGWAELVTMTLSSWAEGQPPVLGFSRSGSHSGLGPLPHRGGETTCCLLVLLRSRPGGLDLNCVPNSELSLCNMPARPAARKGSSPSDGSKEVCGDSEASLPARGALFPTSW